MTKYFKYSNNAQCTEFIGLSTNFFTKNKINMHKKMEIICILQPLHTIPSHIPFQTIQTPNISSNNKYAIYFTVSYLLSDGICHMAFTNRWISGIVKQFLEHIQCVCALCVSNYLRHASLAIMHSYQRFYVWNIFELSQSMPIIRSLHH